MEYAIKILVTVCVVIAASEVAKKFPAFGAVIIALPVTSIIAMSFLYYDTKDSAKVSDFSRSIPPVIIPSIVFFYAFSFLIDKSYGFTLSISLAALLMLSMYAMYVLFITRIGL